MKNVSLNMTTVEVKAEIRPLKCKWTPEMAKDLEVYQGINIDDFAKELARQMRVSERKRKVQNLFP